MTISKSIFKKLLKSENVGLPPFQTKKGILVLVNGQKIIKRIFLINKKTLFNILDTFFVKSGKEN